MILDSIYFGLTQFRNKLFDLGYLKSMSSTLPVISVGNLTVGGTGKTPVIIELAKFFTKKNIKVGVVSRGYKGRYKGAQIVNLSNPQAAKVYGDEPTLIAKKTNNDVVVCKQRIEACRVLEKNNTQLILADDAFQHRYLKRNIDIVLIDATENIKNYKLLPKGRLRESLSGLKRTNAILVTKYNLLADQTDEFDHWFKSLVTNYNLKTKKIVLANYKLASLKAVNGDVVLDKIKKCVLLSGLAQPKAFEQLVKANSIDVLSHQVYPDHHEFKAEEVVQAIKTASDCGCPLLITEKDFVKIKTMNLNNKNIFVVELGIELAPFAMADNSNVEGFYEELYSLVK